MDGLRQPTQGPLGSAGEPLGACGPRVEVVRPPILVRESYGGRDDSLQPRTHPSPGGHGGAMSPVSTAYAYLCLRFTEEYPGLATPCLVAGSLGSLAINGCPGFSLPRHNGL